MWNDKSSFRIKYWRVQGCQNGNKLFQFGNKRDKSVTFKITCNYANMSQNVQTTDLISFRFTPDPTENCHLSGKKLPNTCLFFFQKMVIFIFKNLPFLEKLPKMVFLTIFGKFLEKMTIFGNSLTFKWQFSGRSDFPLVGQSG